VRFVPNGSKGEGSLRLAVLVSVADVEAFTDDGIALSADVEASFGTSREVEASWRGGVFDACVVFRSSAALARKVRC
jgi:hypothetical protein